MAGVRRPSASRHISTLLKSAYPVSVHSMACIWFIRRSLTHTTDNDQHSHEIGEANLMFTKKGRRAAQEAEHPTSTKKKRKDEDRDHGANGVTSASNTTGTFTAHSAPLPNIYAQAQAQVQAQPAVQAPIVPEAPSVAAQERWDRLTNIFNMVRDGGRLIQYSEGNMATLETCLLRLYTEIPVVAPQGMMQQHYQLHQYQPPTDPQLLAPPNGTNGLASAATSRSTSGSDT